MSHDDQPDSRRQWFRDPGHTAVVALIGAAGLLVGGGAGFFTGKSRTPSTTVTTTKPVTVTETITESTESPQSASSGSSVGLEQLNEQEQITTEEPAAADFGNRSIGNRTYSDAVTGEVYADGSGFTEMTAYTKGAFSSLHFVVGIDAEAQCPRGQATVSIEDQSGRQLWGPKVVSISSPLNETIPMSRPLQISFMQRSNETDNGCEGGMAQVSWGDISFSTR